MIAVALVPLTLVLLGRAARALTRPPGRPPPSRPAADTSAVTGAGTTAAVDGERSPRRRWRVLGPVLLALITAVGAGPLLGLAVLLSTAMVLPRWRDVRRQRSARRRVTVDLADTVDLLVVLIHAGLTPMQAVPVLARRAPGSWRPGWAAVDDARRRGVRFTDALDELTVALGPPATPVVEALSSAERYGHPLGPVLDRLSADSRAERRRLAEADARRLPVRLSFPLVCCTLPSFVLLTIAPLLAGALSSLTLPGGHP